MTKKPLHPALAQRAAATKAAHAELSRTVPGFRQLPAREQIRQTHQHVAGGRRLVKSTR